MDKRSDIIIIGSGVYYGMVANPPRSGTGLRDDANAADLLDAIRSHTRNCRELQSSPIAISVGVPYVTRCVGPPSMVGHWSLLARASGGGCGPRLWLSPAHA